MSDNYKYAVNESEVETSPKDAGMGLFLEGDGKCGFHPLKSNDSVLYLFVFWFNT